MDQGLFLPKHCPTAKPNHRLRPSSPRNPLSPPSAPVQRRLQSPPAKSKFLAVGSTAALKALHPKSKLLAVTMVKENLPVSRLIKSDFVTVNAQLATLYGIPDVITNEFVKVKLPADSPRGGYLSQAAFLAAGSNGERTSPTIRGMILMNRFLNDMPPPPPPNVPELGSGVDGPLTNRQLVELHQSRVQCSSCHRKNGCHRSCPGKL